MKIKIRVKKSIKIGSVGRLLDAVLWWKRLKKLNHLKWWFCHCNEGENIVLLFLVTFVLLYGSNAFFSRCLKVMKLRKIFWKNVSSFVNSSCFYSSQKQFYLKYAYSPLYSRIHALCCETVLQGINSKFWMENERTCLFMRSNEK